MDRNREVVFLTSRVRAKRVGPQPSFDSPTSDTGVRRLTKLSWLEEAVKVRRAPVRPDFGGSTRRFRAPRAVTWASCG